MFVNASTKYGSQTTKVLSSFLSNYSYFFSLLVGFLLVVSYLGVKKRMTQNKYCHTYLTNTEDGGNRYMNCHKKKILFGSQRNKGKIYKVDANSKGTNWDRLFYILYTKTPASHSYINHTRQTTIHFS